MASKGVNKVILIGNLGKDPDGRYTPSGTAVTTASIAVNRSYIKDDQRVTETDWFNLEFWNKLAEITNQYLRKGNQIYVEGRLKIDRYEKDGEVKYFTKVVVSELVMLPGGNTSPEEEFTHSDDEIPF